MKKTACLTALTALLALLALPLSAAEPPKALAPAAKPAAEAPKLLKAQDLKWNENLVWVSLVIDEGGVQPVRDYFGALAKADFDALVGGTAKGMMKLQQAFYFNEATRSFTRFDNALPGATVALYQKFAYFRQESIMRIVPLNRQFVENLAISSFLKVEGE